MDPKPRKDQARVSRRTALGTAAASVAVATTQAATVEPATGVRAATGVTAELGRGGTPMALSEVATAARSLGNGEPIAIVDLAALDHNIDTLLGWSARTGIAWRPAHKTLQSPQLLKYVVDRLDRPRVMIHHLRNLDPAMQVLPPGTDFLMGYPPTVGELAHYLSTPALARQRSYRLQICVDSPELLRVLATLVQDTVRPVPIDVVLELDNETPRGGLVLGAELAAVLAVLRNNRGRLRLSGLLCYDALAAAISAPLVRRQAAAYAQRQLTGAVAQIRAQAADFVDVDQLVTNGPGSANYENWSASPAANEFSAGSALLGADYLKDSGYGDAPPAAALYLCAPVLRIPKRLLLGLPVPVVQQVFIKAGGWPTGNNPKLSKMVYPAGLLDEPAYGRGANSSGMLLAPKGALSLGDYVIETAQQVMEAQNHFGALHAVREGTLRDRWPTLDRWGA